jgi:hypothetical protein
MICHILSLVINVIDNLAKKTINFAKKLLSGKEQRTNCMKYVYIFNSIFFF